MASAGLGAVVSPGGGVLLQYLGAVIPSLDRGNHFYNVLLCVCMYIERKCMGRTLGPVLMIGYTGQSLWSDTIMNLYGGRDRHRGAMVVYGGAHWGQS